MDDREEYVSPRALISGMPLLLLAGCGVSVAAAVREMMVGVMVSGLMLVGLAAVLAVAAVVVAVGPPPGATPGRRASRHGP